MARKQFLLPGTEGKSRMGSMPVAPGKGRTRILVAQLLQMVEILYLPWDGIDVIQRSAVGSNRRLVRSSPRQQRPSLGTEGGTGGGEYLLRGTASTLGTLLSPSGKPAVNLSLTDVSRENTKAMPPTEIQTNKNKQQKRTSPSSRPKPPLSLGLLHLRTLSRGPGGARGRKLMA